MYLDEVVDTAGASRITNTPESTLTTLRSRGGGPRFVKLGSRVHYKRRALFEWLAQGERTSTSDRDLEGRGYEEPEVERPEARLHTNL